MSPEEKFRRSPQDDPAAVGAFIAFLRLLRGWSQADLADALDLTAGAVSRYETGDVVPDRDRLEDIAGVVGLPLWMLDRTLLSVAAARSAVASRADPTDLDLQLAALNRNLAAGLFDIACAITAAVLADLPDLDLGPWARSRPASDLEEEQE